jgi:hypothetical protein
MTLNSFGHGGNLAELAARAGCRPDDMLTRSSGRRIALRVCDNFVGLDRRFFRVAVRTRKENKILCHALAEKLGLVINAGPRRRVPDARA